MTNRLTMDKISSFVAGKFSKGNVTALEDIFDDEDLYFYVDHYEDSFDGMLLYDRKDFHIHINIDRGNSFLSKRGRFTIAHELGHYFIDEHRIGLKYDLLKAHGSKHDGGKKEKIELEADYFAGCLLMPEKKFRFIPTGKKFSLLTIQTLSEAFQTSVLSTAIRFVEIGTHEIMVIASKNGIVEWYACSNDFPKWAFKFKVHQAVPPTTVVGEYSRRIGAKYTGAEEVSPDDWFWATGYMAERKMYEQCCYSNSYDLILSFIWFD